MIGTSYSADAFEKAVQQELESHNLDVIFVVTDYLMEHGNWNILQDLLLAVNVEKDNMVKLIGWLTATLPGKEHLNPFRAQLVDAVEKRLKAERPGDVEKLLKGLR